MQSMTPAHLASVLVSCAYLRHYDQELCGVLAEAAEARMPAAKGHQVAMITWALAHLKHDMPGVFAAAAQQVCGLVRLPSDLVFLAGCWTPDWRGFWLRGRR